MDTLDRIEIFSNKLHFIIDSLFSFPESITEINNQQYRLTLTQLMGIEQLILTINRRIENEIWTTFT